MQKARWMQIFLVLGLALIAPAVKANTIGPGGSGAPDTFFLGYSSSPPNKMPRKVIASLSGAWGTALFSGTFYEQVEADPANVFCAGCLDFLFQLNTDSTSTQLITRVTEVGFSAYQTDVGYDSLSLGSLVLCGIDDGGFCNSGNLSSVPSTVDRSLDGDVVGFNFSPGVSLSSHGTVDIVIETNALSFIHPTATITGDNGGTATADIWGPTGTPFSTVPEPSSMLLFSTGLLGLAGVGMKHRKRIA